MKHGARLSAPVIALAVIAEIAKREEDRHTYEQANGHKNILHSLSQ